MKLPGVDNLKKIFSKGLFFILLVTGFFIFHHSAASSHQRFSGQTIEYVQHGKRLAQGFNYPAHIHSAYKRSACSVTLFSKANLCLFHSNETSVQIKSSMQTVLKKPVHSSFYSIKSIPQSGKNDFSAVLA
jgi:hypothetical protein